MIDGVQVTRLHQVHDERGKVMRMLRADDQNFREFGEIYFSTIFPGAIKAWHKHKHMTLNYAVIMGRIKFVLFDDRTDSPTRGQIQELYISPENYYLVSVPPRIWNGFKAVGGDEAIVANCSSMPHDPSEIERLPADSSSIPYSWGIHHS